LDLIAFVFQSHDPATCIHVMVTGIAYHLIVLLCNANF